MKYIKGFFLFWYSFIFGDEIIGASIVIAGFVAAIFLAGAAGLFFWFMPVIVLISVTVSLLRMARESS